VIEIRNLTRTFRSGWFGPRVAALADVSLQIPAGAVVALLGPNGAGKTTLLDLILGLRRPDAGSVTVFGEPAGSRGVLARIGHLSQEPLPWPRLPARQFLRFMAAARGLDREPGRRRVEELLERLDLVAAAGRPLGTYSTGMARRLGIVFALLHRPDLLLLDEPTAGLDPVGSATVREVLLEERARGTTVVLASHHLLEVEHTCSEAVLLVGGRVVGQGPIGRLFAAPDERMLLAAGLDEPGWQRVVAAVTAGGGRVLREGPGLRPPEAVFRELVGGRNPPA
jgi:ABC-2 type transport system ATP-binding protein